MRNGPSGPIENQPQPPATVQGLITEAHAAQFAGDIGLDPNGEPKGELFDPRSDQGRLALRAAGIAATPNSYALVADPSVRGGQPKTEFARRYVVTDPSDFGTVVTPEAATARGLPDYSSAHRGLMAAQNPTGYGARGINANIKFRPVTQERRSRTRQFDDSEGMGQIKDEGGAAPPVIGA